MRFYRSLQQRQECHSGEVHACDIRLVRLLPLFYRFVLPQLLLQVVCALVIWRRFGPCDTCVADQEVDVFLSGLEIFDKALEVCLLRYVTWAQRDDLSAAAIRGVRVCCVLEGFFPSTCDVDFCTVGSESLSSHEADPGTASSHDAHVTFDGEEAVDVEVAGCSHGS